MSEAIFARAPLRLSFGGGGTDTEGFASKYGGRVLSTAIRRYVYVKLTKGEDSFTSYPVDDTDPAYLKRLVGEQTDICLESHIDGSPQSGLGASGALGVAVLGALKAMKDEPLDKNQIAELAYQLEIGKRPIGGRQDHYAASWGGLNLMEFGLKAAVVMPVTLDREIILALEKSLLLVFIHPRVNSSYLVMADELSRVEKREQKVIQALLRQKELAKLMLEALQEHDLRSFGELLDDAWQMKKQQAPLCTNQVIDGVYDIALKAGALGGKLAGAGAGGYMFLFAPGKEGEVTEAMRIIGLKVENISLEEHGVTVWSEKKNW